MLGWMPKGTHHWRKLVKPGEITAALGEEFEPSAFMRVILLERSLRLGPRNLRSSLLKQGGSELNLTFDLSSTVPDGRALIKGKTA